MLGLEACTATSAWFMVNVCVFVFVCVSVCGVRCVCRCNIFIAMLAHMLIL